MTSFRMTQAEVASLIVDWQDLPAAMRNLRRSVAAGRDTRSDAAEVEAIAGRIARTLNAHDAAGGRPRLRVAPPRKQKSAHKRLTNRKS